MKKLSAVFGMFIFSVVFANEPVPFEYSSYGVETPTYRKGCDSIYYHSWYKDGLYSGYEDITQCWVFVRFSPPEIPWIMSAYDGILVHSLILTSSIPCTLGIWDTYPPTAANLKFLRATYDDGTAANQLVGSLPITMNGDFCMGFGSVKDAASGEWLRQGKDKTAPATANRNYYATSRYGTQNLYSSYDFIMTAIRCTGAGVEERIGPHPFYLKVESNPVVKGKEINFAYRIASESTLKIYGLDGRLVSSRLLEAGESKLLWNPGLPTGIYFYKVEPFSHGKIVVL